MEVAVTSLAIVLHRTQREVIDTRIARVRIGSLQRNTFVTSCRGTVTIAFRT